MVGRLLTALWEIALALSVLMWVADFVRDDQSVISLAAVIFSISIVVLVRTRGSSRRTAPVDGTKAEQSPAVFDQLSKPDQVRVASLAASGNAIGAIKALRKLISVDLRTAKDAVDHFDASTDE